MGQSERGNALRPHAFSRFSGTNFSRHSSLPRRGAGANLRIVWATASAVQPCARTQMALTGGGQGQILVTTVDFLVYAYRIRAQMHPLPSRKEPRQPLSRYSYLTQAIEQGCCVMLIITILFFTVVLVLLPVILHHWGRKQQEQERQEMAQHVRRDMNSTAGWKEYE